MLFSIEADESQLFDLVLIQPGPEAEWKFQNKGVRRDTLLDSMTSNAKPCHGTEFGEGPIMQVRHMGRNTFLLFSVKPCTLAAWQEITEYHEHYRWSHWRRWGPTSSVKRYTSSATGYL